MRWRDLKRSTPEQETAFGEMLKSEKVSFGDKLLMVLTAYGVILVPCVLILLGMCLLTALLLHLL